MGRNPKPSYSLIDSQSVKTTSKAKDIPLLNENAGILDFRLSEIFNVFSTPVAGSTQEETTKKKSPKIKDQKTALPFRRGIY
jgi:hypothetical protein